MELNTIWEIAKNLGPGGAVLCLLLWLDERRERRQVQRHVSKLHGDNTKRLEKLLRQIGRIDRVLAAPATSIAKSGRTKRIGGR